MKLSNILQKQVAFYFLPFPFNSRSSDSNTGPPCDKEIVCNNLNRELLFNCVNILTESSHFQIRINGLELTAIKINFTPADIENIIRFYQQVDEILTKIYRR